MALALFADSVITIPAPKTEHQGESLGNPLPAAGHACFGPSKLVGAEKRKLHGCKKLHFQGTPTGLSPKAGPSRLGGSIQLPIGHCPHPSNRYPIAVHSNLVTIAVNKKSLHDIKAI